MSKKEKICCGLKVLGIFQVVMSILLVCTAFQIDAGLFKVGRETADIIQQAYKTIPGYKSLYEKSSKNIIQLKSVLNNTSVKCDNIAETFSKADKPPFSIFLPEAAEKALTESADDIHKLSNVLRQQAVILQEYSDTTLLQTLEFFDITEKCLKDLEISINRLNTSSHTALILTFAVCGILFLLNGITTIFIAALLKDEKSSIKIEE